MKVKNKKSNVTKEGELSLKKIASTAEKASRKGTSEYKSFIDKHRKSLKKLANR
jgi:hypothetical protein